MTTISIDPRPDSIRSRVVTVLDVALCVLFTAGGVFLWWALTWGPESWTTGPSLQFVAGLGLPWPALGVLWLAYSLLLTNRWTRAAGYWLGVALVGYLATSLINAAADDRLTNVLVLVVVVFAGAGQVSGAVRSMVTAERRR